jgi:broad specificity phosphatase PhoE
MGVDVLEELVLAKECDFLSRLVHARHEVLRHYMTNGRVLLVTHETPCNWSSVDIRSAANPVVWLMM